MIGDCDFLKDVCSIDDPEEVQQFFSELGRKSAVNYIIKHNITRPPKDEAEALQWSREAHEEFMNEL